MDDRVIGIDREILHIKRPGVARSAHGPELHGRVRRDSVPV